MTTATVALRGRTVVLLLRTETDRAVGDGFVELKPGERFDGRSYDQWRKLVGHTVKTLAELS
jgi:hypothetical protein